MSKRHHKLQAFVSVSALPAEEEVEPLHFNIFKMQPETGERVLLHERIPEQLVDWLCKMCDLELSAADRAHGWVIFKESLTRPLKRSRTSTRRQAEGSGHRIFSDVPALHHLPLSAAI